MGSERKAGNIIVLSIYNNPNSKGRTFAAEFFTFPQSFMSLFSDFAMREELTRAIAHMGYETPTPIQAKTIPQLLNEPSDIIGLAQTGTGKTAAFGLPLLNRINLESREVQALVLSPTRELCMQIEVEFGKYGQFMKGFHGVAVYGGVPIGGQIRDLKRGAQVVVATPGRLIDLLERGAIHLENVQVVVLDEADEMLNMGFREDIDFILNHTPSPRADLAVFCDDEQ